MTVGNNLHVFKGSRADQAQKVLWLTDEEENAEDGYVVANVSHKLVQQVRLWHALEQDSRQCMPPSRRTPPPDAGIR